MKIIKIFQITKINLLYLIKIKKGLILFLISMKNLTLVKKKKIKMENFQQTNSLQKEI